MDSFKLQSDTAAYRKNQGHKIYYLIVLAYELTLSNFYQITIAY